MMTSPQLHPLRVNPATNEPFLCLPSPCSNIIITPPRMTDKSALISGLNDPRVYDYLSNPPYPYLEEHAEDYLSSVKANTDSIIHKLMNADVAPDTPAIIVDGCPVATLREVQDRDGDDIFVGSCDLQRYKFDYVKDEQERDKLTKENLEKPVGDPTIVWTVGYWLMPDYHGKGITTTALTTLLREWAIPRMGVRKICGGAYVGNLASKRVMEKAGFEFAEIVEEAVRVRGQSHDMYILDWHLEG